MHLSAHTWPRPEPLKATLDRVASLGYRSVVLTGEPGLYDTVDTLRLLDDYGLPCWGAASVMQGQRNLAAADPDQRRTTVHYLVDLVRLVADMGGSVVTIVPVAVGTIVAEAGAQEEWSWLVEGLRVVDAEAGRCGVGLAVEPINRFETYLVNRAEQALALAEDVSDTCGVCLDTFHLNIEESDLHAAIRTIGPRLRSVDVADNNRLAPGMGALDWSAITRTLCEVGYAGALAAEFLPPIDRSRPAPVGPAADTEPLPETSDFVRIHGSGAVSDAYYDQLAQRTAQTLLPLLAALPGD